jgi:hypothetical protein
MLRPILVLTLMATVCAAQAQSPDQFDEWRYADNATDDQTVQGCSAIITSGRETGENRVRAFVPSPHKREGTTI